MKEQDTPQIPSADILRASSHISNETVNLLKVKENVLGVSVATPERLELFPFKDPVHMVITVAVY